MSFQQGLSGLYASSKALDVTSNNVANSATVGFKSAQAHFSDVYANSLAGAGAAQVGIGTSLAGIQQSFTQGNITSTNNPLDISVNGGGFFRMNNDGNITYSRNGQFHLDKDGYVVDDNARRLTGYPVQNGVVVPSSPQDLKLSSDNIAPLVTGGTAVAGLGGGVGVGVNFDSRSVVPANPFSINDPTSYNWSTATTIYDSLGNAHNLTMYAVKAAGTGDWTVHTNVDGTPEANSATTFALHFDTSGVLQTGGTGLVTIDLNQVMIDTGLVNNAATPLTFNIDFTKSSQFGASFGVNSLSQDGYTSGRLTGVSVGKDGVVRGNYSNGQSKDLGQVVLANFTNANGLSSLGGNQWAETSASGSALVGAPNTGTLGVLQSAAVEESNTDLTAELVNMITQQRNYQANAQSIKTQDQIMQTLVNLR